MSQSNGLVIEYGSSAVDFAGLPNISVRAMLSRGLAHYLGNEQSAKIGPNSSWFAKFEKDNGRKPTEDEVKAQKAVHLANALKALAEGTVGATRGPKLDPIEAEIDRMAEREVWDTLSGAGLTKANKKPKDDDTFTFSNGDTFSFETLIERRIEKHGDRLRAAATKKVEAETKARKASQEKAKKAAEAGPVSSPDALGL